ncbi:BnaA05g16220D [Brassica napus]|uniref:BnaA05g16220D protein n=1 Tax=Brassica napus TaxID=3708 RepID=A0A078GS89_BRANA|nr:BnaA05g16220D [Brassica napus]
MPFPISPSALHHLRGKRVLLPTYTVFWKNNYSLIFGTSKNKQLKELREMEEFELHHWWSLRLRIRSLRLLDIHHLLWSFVEFVISFKFWVSNFKICIYTIN